MSSPARMKPAASSGAVAPAARLIPGKQPFSDDAARKRPQSVSIDGQFWTGEKPNPAPASSRNAFQSIARAVLPGPFVPAQRCRLAWNVFADFILLGLSFAAIPPLGLALQFTIHRDLAAVLTPLRFPVSGTGLLLLYGVLVTMLGHSDGLYRTDLCREPGEERIILGKATVWAMVLDGAAIYQMGIPAFPLGLLACAALLGYVAMVGWRDCWRAVAARKIARGLNVRNVLIVGAGRLGQEVANQLDRSHNDGRVVRGFLDENHPLGGEVRGRTEDLARVARAEFADEVVLTISRQPELSRRVIREARRNRLDVTIVPDLFGCEPDSVVLNNLGALPVLTVHQEPIPVLGLFMKRTFDVVCSAAALIVAAPLMAPIAMAIKLHRLHRP